MYEVSEVQRPPNETQISNYSAIRLLGLKTDPRAFSSTYERESKFTRDQWRERLSTPGRATFLVDCISTNHSDSKNEVRSCVGTATVLTPVMLEPAGFLPPKRLAANGEAVYALVGMWIHQDHKRRGLASQLIKAIKERVRADVSQERRKILVLEVHEHNMAAKTLYQTQGFVDEGTDGDSGEIWMSFRLEPEFEGRD